MSRTWKTFYDEGLGPSLPLSKEQRAQSVSGVLPSGESNMLDFAQQGKAINKNFPSPRDPEDRHDIVFTSGEEPVTVNETGIFHYEGERGRFSSPTETPSGLGERLQAFYRPPQSNKPREAYTFRVQDSYIHHKPYGNKGVEILFLSSYNEAIQLDRYGNLNSYYNAGY